MSLTTVPLQQLSNTVSFVVATSAAPVWQNNINTYSNNGVITAMTPVLQTAFVSAGIWMYHANGSINTANGQQGNAEGIYWTVPSSNTTANVYNIVLNPGTVPYIPSANLVANSAFTTANGAGTITNSGSPKLLFSIPIPANSLGYNGRLDVTGQAYQSGFNGGFGFGPAASPLGNPVGNFPFGQVNSGGGEYFEYFTNYNSPTAQVFEYYVGGGINGASHGFRSVDTTQPNYLNFYTNSSASNYTIFSNFKIVISPTNP